MFAMNNGVMAPLCFGLTGGVASGKSTVAKHIIGTRGIPVIDADDLAREAMQEGPVFTEVLHVFGPAAKKRKELAKIVFNDKEALKKLEAILHPMIADLSQKHIKELHEAGHPVVAYDAALLIEAGESEKFRPLIVVWAPEPEQVARAMTNRGWTREETLARISRQLPLNKKQLVADYIIENDKDLASLYKRTDVVLDAILTKAGYDPADYRSTVTT